jgi:AmiR/NasT family two-component response regulator
MSLGEELDPAMIDERVAEALEEIERQTHAKVLIIEDEPIIAMDIRTIVQDLGHEVVGIAKTKSEALQLSKQLSLKLYFSTVRRFQRTRLAAHPEAAF